MNITINLIEIPNLIGKQVENRDPIEIRKEQLKILKLPYHPDINDYVDLKLFIHTSISRISRIIACEGSRPSRRKFPTTSSMRF